MISRIYRLGVARIGCILHPAPLIKGTLGRSLRYTEEIVHRATTILGFFLFLHARPQDAAALEHGSTSLK